MAKDHNVNCAPPIRAYLSIPDLQVTLSFIVRVIDNTPTMARRDGNGKVVTAHGVWW